MHYCIKVSDIFSVRKCDNVVNIDINDIDILFNKNYMGIIEVW